MEQRILQADKGYSALDTYFEEAGIKRLQLVCGPSLRRMEIGQYFDTLKARKGIDVLVFSGFAPNPNYTSVLKGIEHFRRNRCDMVVAAGGGSAIDVAKCIKLYSNMDMKKDLLQQEIIDNGIKLLAIPTTAGSGSEATKFAVIYRDGEKQSISHESCLPSSVLLDPSCLRSLPGYIKKSALLDALCHAIESYWSINATEESKGYSKVALEAILSVWRSYLAGKNEDTMLYAANAAGKAINITQTTSGHAMAYKLTTMYGIAHGYAVALCVSELWPYMIAHLEKCADIRGVSYLKAMFCELAAIMGYATSDAAIAGFRQILETVGLPMPEMRDASEYEILKASVNPIRLRNTPITLDNETIGVLYRRILKEKER